MIKKVSREKTELVLEEQAVQCSLAMNLMALVNVIWKVFLVDYE